MIAPKTVIRQAEPEPIPPEEVLPPEGGHQALLPDEGPQTQVPNEAEMPEGVQQLLNPDEPSEYSWPSEDTPPVKNKGKAVLRSAAWRPLPSREEIPINMGPGHPHLDEEVYSQLTTSRVVILPDPGSTPCPRSALTANLQLSISRHQLPDTGNRS